MSAAPRSSGVDQRLGPCLRCTRVRWTSTWALTWTAVVEFAWPWTLSPSSTSTLTVAILPRGFGDHPKVSVQGQGRGWSPGRRRRSGRRLPTTSRSTSTSSQGRSRPVIDTSSGRRGDLGLDRGLALAERRIAQLGPEPLPEPGVADPAVAVRDPRLAGLDDRARRRQREAEPV